jgi:hypothetical protein
MQKSCQIEKSRLPPQEEDPEKDAGRRVSLESLEEDPARAAADVHTAGSIGLPNRRRQLMRNQNISIEVMTTEERISSLSFLTLTSIFLNSISSMDSLLTPVSLFR